MTTECICRHWCRGDLWGQIIDGRKYPAPNHADGCPAQVREQFTVLVYAGARVTLEPQEAERVQADAPGMYQKTTVMLTRDQFERMAEFAGF